jgi:hypothetical protein
MGPSTSVASCRILQIEYSVVFPHMYSSTKRRIEGVVIRAGQQWGARKPKWEWVFGFGSGDGMIWAFMD